MRPTDPDTVKRPRVARACSLVLAAALAFPAAAFAQDASPLPGGFWKCRVKGDVKAEFNGEDPIGLAAGKHISTSCAINHPRDGGKIYCYSSLPSLKFLTSNPELLQKAQAFWDKEQGGRPKGN